MIYSGGERVEGRMGEFSLPASCCGKHRGVDGMENIEDRREDESVSEVAVNETILHEDFEHQGPPVALLGGCHGRERVITPDDLESGIRVASTEGVTGMAIMRARSSIKVISTDQVYLTSKLNGSSSKR